MAGEDYTPPGHSHIFTIPKYTEAADAPQAFKDFAESIVDGIGDGIDAPVDREGQVIQSLDGSTWEAGMAFTIVETVPLDSAGEVGDVVFVLSDPKVEEPGLPGLGGWADVNSVTGASGNRYTYTADGVDWVAYEFTDDGTITTSGGLVDALVVGGGGGNYHSNAGYGGRIIYGLHKISGQASIVCGAGAGQPGGAAAYVGAASSLGELRVGDVSMGGNNEGWGTGADHPDAMKAGIKSQITGVEKEYGAAGKTNAQLTPGLGEGGTSGNRGSNGSVTVRVPKANAKATLPDTGWVDA